MFKKTCALMLCAALMLVFTSRCGEDSSTVSSLIGAFPSELAIASPTAASTARRGTLINSLQISEGSSYAEKKEAISGVLEGATISACTFVPNLVAQTTNANCYGPTIDYENHPEGTPANSNLPGGDLGIWEATETDIACSAAQLNQMVGGIAGQVDTAILSLASLKCVMEANSISPPAVGSSVDLTTAINAAFTTNNTGLTVTAASLALATDAQSKEVYTWTMTATGSVTLPQRATATGTITLRLKHVKTGTDTYKGKLSYKLSVPMATALGGHCNDNTSTTGFTDGTSIGYEKTSATSLTYMLHSGQFCSSSADPFTSATNFTVDNTKKLDPPTLEAGWANNFNYALFNLDPSTGLGNFQFAWQAGYGDGNTRVFNASLTSGTPNTGNAYFGFGPAAESTTGVGTIDRMICNWAGPGNNHTGVSKAQHQAITQDATTGKWTATSSAIAYDPVNSCESNDGSFRYKKTSDSTWTNANTTTSNLINLSSVSVTAPTVPTDVD